MKTDHCSSIRSRWLAAEWRPRELDRDGGNRSMDMTWVTGRIAVGGGIWTAENMATVARAGVSHILDMQIEFDDTALAAPHNIIVQWTPTDDDFQPKPPEIFQRGVNFARQALDEEGCDEVDWRQASRGRLCGCVRAQRGEVPGAACTGSEVVALGGVVTKTAPEFGCLS